MLSLISDDCDYPAHETDLMAEAMNHTPSAIATLQPDFDRHGKFADLILLLANPAFLHIADGNTFAGARLRKNCALFAVDEVWILL